MGQHGVVVLLAEDGQHLRAGLFADEGALCHLREQRCVIAGGCGAKVAVAVKVERIVQHRVGKAQLPDAGIDRIQPQIVDDHIGGDVVRADDHHGGGVLHLERRTHAQRPQHTRAVHELALLVGDALVQAGLAPADLQIQRRQDECLDGRGRLERFIGPDLDRAALQVVHKNAHLALIGVQFGRDPLFQRHIFIHFGIFPFLFTDFPRRSAGRCGRRSAPPRPR